jgi:hypothetical protein
VTYENPDKYQSIPQHVERYGRPLSIVHFLIIGVAIGFFAWVICQF